MLSTHTVAGAKLPTLYDLPHLYDLIVQPGPCESFYRELAREAGGPILELACGTGRLTLPIARDGHAIIGLDSAPAMLDAARQKATAEGLLRIEFIRSDMRTFDLGRRFALVIVSCNSLAHLITIDEIASCFRSIARHLLAPDGVFAFDIANPDVRALARSSSHSVRLDQGPNPSAGIAIEERSTYDAARQVREASWRISDPRAGAREVAPLRLRQIFPQELPLLLSAAGLALRRRYGDFSCGVFHERSLNQVCLARA